MRKMVLLMLWVLLASLPSAEWAKIPDQTLFLQRLGAVFCEMTECKKAIVGAMEVGDKVLFFGDCVKEEVRLWSRFVSIKYSTPRSSGAGIARFARQMKKTRSANFTCPWPCGTWRCEMKRYARIHKVTKHHILPQSRGGNSDPANILYLPRFKHDAWHALFGLRTIDEAIGYLKELRERRQAVWRRPPVATGE